jgi:uncharacterized membrane protein YciS (DUF1049 family)
VGWGLPYYHTQSETSSVYICFRKLTVVRGVIVYAGLPCISVIVAGLYVRVSHKNMEKEKKRLVWKSLHVV